MLVVPASYLEQRPNVAVVAHLRRRDAEFVPEALGEMAVAGEPKLECQGAEVDGARRELFECRPQAQRLPEAVQAEPGLGPEDPSEMEGRGVQAPGELLEAQACAG